MLLLFSISDGLSKMRLRADTCRYKIYLRLDLEERLLSCWFSSKGVPEVLVGCVCGKLS